MHARRASTAWGGNSRLPATPAQPAPVPAQHSQHQRGVGVLRRLSLGGGFRVSPLFLSSVAPILVPACMQTCTECYTLCVISRAALTELGHHPVLLPLHPPPSPHPHLFLWLVLHRARGGPGGPQLLPSEHPKSPRERRHPWASAS